MFEYFKLFIMVQGKRSLVNRESETIEYVSGLYITIRCFNV